MAVLTKQPSEELTFALDFEDQLDTGDSLASVTSVTESTGTITPGTGSISGTKVRFTVAGGTDGTVYLIEAIAVTTNGETLEADGYLFVTDTPAASDMLLTVSSIQVRVADFLGWGRNSEGTGDDWDDDTTARLREICKSGISRVVYPVMSGQNGAPHQWSWLFTDTILTTSAPYETGTIAVSSGVVTLTDGTFPSWAAQGELVVSGTRYVVSTRDGDTQITLDDTSIDVDSGTSYALHRYIYSLPSDFEAPKGKFVYHADQADGYPALVWCSVQEVREKRRRYTSTTDYPRRIARRPATFATGTGQRYEALIEPTPDAAYRFHYEYRLNINVDIDANVFLRGGPMISEVIEESCLAVAEQRYQEDGSREHTELFHQMLLAAIEADKVNSSLGSLGADRGGELCDVNDELSLIPTVTFDGVEVDDL